MRILLAIVVMAFAVSPASAQTAGRVRTNTYALALSDGWSANQPPSDRSAALRHEFFDETRAMCMISALPRDGTAALTQSQVNSRYDRGGSVQFWRDLLVRLLLGGEFTTTRERVETLRGVVGNRVLGRYVTRNGVNFVVRGRAFGTPDRAYTMFCMHMTGDDEELIYTDGIERMLSSLTPL